MKPHVEEAVQVLRIAARDVQAFDVLKETPEVHISIVCFHAQQAIEKSLKAVLFLHQIEFRRTHNLTELAGLLRQHRIDIPVKDEQLKDSTPLLLPSGMAMISRSNWFHGI